MPSITEIQEDDPIATASNIIGSYISEGRCYYDGRPQGGKVQAETEGELVKLLNKKHLEIMEDQGEAVKLIYPDNSLWELRIFFL